MKRCRLAPTVAALGVSLLLCGLVATAPAAAPTVPVAHTAADESGLPYDKIAGLLFDFAKDPAKEFVFRQLGIATNASRIEALSQKIDR